MFKLNIESSQDIEELNIKFKNGQSVTTSVSAPDTSQGSQGSQEPDPPRGTVEKRKKLPEYLDIEEFAESHETAGIPEKPIIPDRDRAPSIAPELMRLDI